MLSKLKQLNNEIMHEAIDPKRLQNASLLLKQFKEIGVDTKKSDFDEIQTKLAKLLSLVPNSSINMVYTGLLAPMLVQLVKFEHFPIPADSLAEQVKKSKDLKAKNENFPYDIFDVMVRRDFLKYAHGKKEKDLIYAYNNNVKDLIDYLVLIGLRTGYLSIPTK